jgi:hypothetical protein
MSRRIAALALLVCCAGVSTAQKGLTAKQKKADLAVLKASQRRNGGFVGWNFDTPTIAGTYFALKAYAAAGVKAPNQALVKKFVLSQWKEKAGGFPDAGPEANAEGTGWGLMCLVELKASTPKFEKAGLAFLEANVKKLGEVYWACLASEALGQKPAARPEWVKILDAAIDSLRVEKGRSTAVRRTALVTACRLSMGLKIDAEKVDKVFADGQLANGGWELYAGWNDPDLMTTWEVVDCYLRQGKAPPRPKAIRAFINSLRDKKGGYGQLKKRPGSMEGTLYAYKILAALDELEKKE